MQSLRVKDRMIINEVGEEVLLKGYGIGNWMNQEGFLFGSATFDINFKEFQRADKMDRGRAIDQIIRELCGTEYADKFWKNWYRNYFGEVDIKDLAESGFNSVRLPFAAKVFLKEEPSIAYNEDAFEILDQVIDWCEENHLYVILDMHAAVSGQSGLLCDDGVDNIPHLYIDEESWERTLLLWEKLVERYCNRSVIAGYDVLNEPLALPRWDEYLPKLRAFYDEAIMRIRKIDQKHILFLEGHRFSSRADIFDVNMDPEYHNWVFAPHMYEALPDMGMLGPLLQASEELNVPLWMGETGGNKEWMTTFYEMLYENHVGVNIWCHKSEGRADAASLYSYFVPEGWDQVIGYSHRGEVKPSYEKAIQIFDNLLENIKLDNCIAHKDRACAILRKPGVTVPAIGYDMLPGEGESFQGYYPYCVFCGYRREDRMHLVYEQNYSPLESPNFSFCAIKKPPKYGDWMHLDLKLHEGDFACYQIRKIESKTKVSIECYAKENAKLLISCRDMENEVAVSGGEQMLSLDAGVILAGEDTAIKVMCIEGEVILHSITFA